MDYLKIEVNESVAVLTFDNPSVLNALSKEVLLEIQVAIKELSANPEVKVLVLKGEGKAFIAGANIKQMQSMNACEAKELSRLGNDTMDLIASFPHPVIAAVNGFALGGGLEVALSADFIYASAKAKLGLPEVTLGLIPGFGGHKKLTDRIGAAKAKELAFTGRMVSATQAKEMGIVNEVCEPDELMDKVMAVAEEIKAVSASAVSLAKEVANQCVDNSKETANTIEVNAFGLIFSHPDAVEGKNAFVEKRKPVWSH